MIQIASGAAQPIGDFPQAVCFAQMAERHAYKVISNRFIFVAYKKLTHNQELAYNIMQNINTKIVVPEPIINVGKIENDRTLKVAFKIINTGEFFLRFDRVEADCHCTVNNWQKKPIAPNDTTLIEVEYDASIPGFFRQKISIFIPMSMGRLSFFCSGERSFCDFIF